MAGIIAAKAGNGGFTKIASVDSPATGDTLVCTPDCFSIAVSPGGTVGQLNELQVKASQSRDKEYMLSDGRACTLASDQTTKSWCACRSPLLRLQVD